MACESEMADIPGEKPPVEVKGRWQAGQTTKEDVTPPPSMQSKDSQHHFIEASAATTSPAIENMLVCSSGANEVQSEASTVEECAVVRWINHCLKMKPGDRDIVVDLHTDLRDGVLLRSLVRKLTGRQDILVSHNTFPMTSQQMIESVEAILAVLEGEGLQVLHHDNASKQIVDGNFSFTMKTCRSLIERFHFTFGNSVHAQSLAAHRERLFLWLKAVLPDYKAEQFRTEDWRDGSLLASLLAYTTGMQHSTNELADIIAVAESTLGIPSIFKPDDLDTFHGEFALLVYLYFFAKHCSPGQLKLLEWVNSLPPCNDHPVLDFQQKWAPGHLVYRVVHCLLPNIPSVDSLADLNANQIAQTALTAAEQVLSISPSFPAATLSLPTTDPFSLIVFLSQLQAVQDGTQYCSSIVLVKNDSGCSYCVGSTVCIALDDIRWPDAALEAVVQCDSSEEKVLLKREEGADKRKNTFSFVPTHSGEFKMTITCNGVKILHIPLAFDVYDSTQCQLVTPIQLEYPIGQPVELKVSSANAGKGKLTAIVVRHISTLPTLPISVSDQPLLPFGVLPPHQQPLLPSGPGQAQHSMAASDTQRDTHHDPKTSPLHTEIQANVVAHDSETNLHEVSFTPHQTGEHVLSIYWNGIPIPESPVSINIYSPACTVQGLGMEEAFEGLESDFDIIVSCKDGMNEVDSLSVHITHQNDTCGEVKSDIKILKDSREKCHRKYRCSYIPPVAPSCGEISASNNLLIDVKWHDSPVLGSPFLVHVYATTPSQRCFIREYPASHLVAGRPITTIIDATKAGSACGRVEMDDFKVVVTHGDSSISKQEIKLREDSNGVFAVEFTPPSKDVYLVDIYYQNELIADSGLKFTVEEVVIESSPEICLLDEPIKLILDASCASSTVVDEQEIEPGLCDLDSQGEKNLSGSFSNEFSTKNMFPLKFTPQKAGRYKINVNFDDQTLSNNFHVKRPPLANPQLLVVSFTHNNTNCLVTLRLIAKHSILEGFLEGQDQQGVGSKTGNILQLTFHPDLEKEGEYGITLCTTVPDVYSLTLHYFGELLTCCPCTVDVRPAVAIFDPVIPFQVGTSSFIELVFDTSETHKTSAGDFKIEVLSSTTQSEIPTYLSEESPDLFRVRFRPIQDDDYHVEVSWFCLPIAGSPFLIPFRQRLGVPQVKVSYQSHMGPRISIQARLTVAGDEDGSLYSSATCVTRLGDTVKTTFPQNATNISSALGSHTDGSESFAKVPPPDGLLLDDHHTATSDDAESMSDSYSVQGMVSLPRIAVQQHKQGHYEIWFVDYLVGKYSLDVLCTPRRRIKGSPFLIDTTSVPRLASSKGVSREMMESVQICRGTRHGYLAASVTGNKTGPTSISMAMTSRQDKAIIKFEDEVRDVYTLNLFWYTRQYELFKGAPFLLTEHHKSAINANKDNTAI